MDRRGGRCESAAAAVRAEGSEGTSGGDALAGSERCEASESGEVRGDGGQRRRVAVASGGACRRRAQAGGGWGVGQAIGPSGQRAMRSALQTRSEGPETKCRVAGCHTTEGSLLVSVGVNVNAGERVWLRVDGGRPREREVRAELLTRKRAKTNPQSRTRTKGTDWLAQRVVGPNAYGGNAGVEW